MNELLELSEKSKIIGLIYCMTNNITGKKYIGQTLSHRKNKGKYRPFGIIGRFNDHISEAINNTKKNQCVYLNNAIRKYGKQNFSIELIIKCSPADLDELEIKNINKYNTLHPNGYNLTKGGKTLENINITNNTNLQEKSKRGREYGYAHKQSTKEIMSERLKDISKNQNRDIKMKNVMNNYYDSIKINILSSYDLSEDYDTYIKPVRRKESNEIYNYIIKINGRKLTLRDNNTLQEKYERLKNIIDKAREKIVE